MKRYVTTILTALTLLTACDDKECAVPRNGQIGVELSATLTPAEYAAVLTKCVSKETTIPVTYDNWLDGDPNAFLVLEARFLTTKVSADCIREKMLQLGGTLTPEGTTGDIVDTGNTTG